MQWNDRAISLIRRAVLLAGEDFAPEGLSGGSSDPLSVRRGGALYLIDQHGTAVRLNETASFIWTQWSAGKHLPEFAQAYSENFKIDPAQAELDVRGFVERFGSLTC